MKKLIFLIVFSIIFQLVISSVFAFSFKDIISWFSRSFRPYTPLGIVTSESSGSETTFTIQLEAGWNPVSSPIEEGIDVQEIKNTCGYAQVRYWSNESGYWGYKDENTKLKAGTGYLVLVMNNCGLNITGTPYFLRSMNLVAGQNILIGAFSETFRVADILGTCDLSKLTVKIYDKKIDSNILADTLETEKSYWIKSDIGCSFGEKSIITTTIPVKTTTITTIESTTTVITSTVQTTTILPQHQFIIRLEAGWNPVSSPIEEGIDVQEIKKACDYVQVHYWTGTSYEDENVKLRPGLGYLVLVLNNCNFNIVGTPYSLRSIDLLAGKNLLIGAYDVSYKVTDILGTCDLNKLNVTIYDKNTDDNIPTDTLETMKSYWIKSDVDCTFGKEPVTTTTTIPITTTTIESSTSTTTSTTTSSTILSTTTTIPSNNQKDMSMYTDKTVFLISDKNWRDVLSLVPVTVWTNDGGSISKYPMLIYHDETNEDHTYNIGSIVSNIDDISFQNNYDIKYLMLTTNDCLPYFYCGKIISESFSDGNLYPQDIFTVNFTIKNLMTSSLNLNNFQFYMYSKKMPLMDLIGYNFSKNIWSPNEEINLSITFKNNFVSSDFFDMDSPINFIQQYEPSSLLIVGNTSTDFDDLLYANSPLGAELTSDKILRMYPKDYISFWNSIDSVVVVDYDNYEEGLMASAWASYKNAPILFINSGNMNDYKNLLDGKLVYVIGNLDSIVKDYIENNARETMRYTITQLQDEYKRLTNTDKIILTNPSDINFSYDALLNTERYSYISKLFAKHSLAAPILASAKHEIILTNKSNDYEIVSNFTKETMQRFFYQKACSIEDDCFSGLKVNHYTFNTSKEIKYSFNVTDYPYPYFYVTANALVYGCNGDANVSLYFYNVSTGKDDFIGSVKKGTCISNDVFYDPYGEEFTRTVSIPVWFSNPPSGELNFTFKVIGDGRFLVGKKGFFGFYQHEFYSDPTLKEYNTEVIEDKGVDSNSEITYRFNKLDSGLYSFSSIIPDIIGTYETTFRYETNIQNISIYVNDEYIQSSNSLVLIPDSAINKDTDETIIKFILNPVEDHKGWAKLRDLKIYKSGYITILATPYSVPDKIPNGRVADWKYGSLDDSSVYLVSGRIASITTSDVSSYIARSLFYNQIFYKIYDGNYTGLSIAHTINPITASKIKIATSNAGYDSICFDDLNDSVCDNNVHPNATYYKKRQFITFSDHGNCGVWYPTLGVDDIPWLDLSYVFGNACDTNDFNACGERTFGAKIIRKGAIGYNGAVRIATAGDYDIDAIKILTSSERPLSLGEVYFGSTYTDDFNLLGDPTLVPIFKKVAW